MSKLSEVSEIFITYYLYCIHVCLVARDPPPTNIMSQPCSPASDTNLTPGDEVILRKRPPKLSETKTRDRRISAHEGSDNLSDIVESLRLKWALLARQFSSRDPTFDSSFPKEPSVDTCDLLISDVFTEDLTNEQDFTSTQAMEFRGCARDILEELETLISAATPGGAMSTEDDSVMSQGITEEWMHSLVEYYYQQQISAAGYALDCVATCTVEAVISKSIMFVMVEDYKEKEQHHLREIMHIIDTTFPKGSGHRNALPFLTSSMVEVHVKGRLKYFKKKLAKIQANNSILDWVQGTPDKKQIPQHESIISWMIAVPSSSSSSSSEEEDVFSQPKSLSLIKSSQQDNDFDTSQNLSEHFDPKRSISDVTFSFSRQASRDLSILLHYDPATYRKLSDSSCLSSSFPSNLTERNSLDCSRSLERMKDSSYSRQSKRRWSDELVQTQLRETAQFKEEVQSTPIGTELLAQPAQLPNEVTDESTPIESDLVLKECFGGVRMRRIKGRGKQHSPTLPVNDISVSPNPEMSEPVSAQSIPPADVTKRDQDTRDVQTSELLTESQRRLLTQPRRPSRGLLKASRSFEEGNRSRGRCVDFDPRTYKMPSLVEVDPMEQAYLDEVHEDIMRSKRLNRKSLVPSFSFDVGEGIPDDLGPDSVTMPLPASCSIYKITQEVDIGEEFEKFEQDWRAFQVAFEADVYSTRHRLRQSSINLNRKLERIHEYSSSLDECIAILARSVTQETFHELEEAFRINISSLNTTLEEVVTSAQNVGCLSQEYKDNANFQLCFSYVDKLKYKSNTVGSMGSVGHGLPTRQDSTISTGSDTVINEDVVQAAIERFISAPAQQRRWPSFHRERSEFTAQQNQVTRELKIITQNYDHLVESSKRDLSWCRVSIKLFVFSLFLILLLVLTSESKEDSFNTLLANLRLR